MKFTILGKKVVKPLPTKRLIAKYIGPAWKLKEQCEEVLGLRIKLNVKYE